MQLANVTEIFSVTHIAPGTYNRIRLTLTKVELVKKNVFGDSDITGCLKAETIIYEAEGATIPVQPLP